MELYKKPVMEIVELERTDVLTDSPTKAAASYELVNGELRQVK